MSTRFVRQDRSHASRVAGPRHRADPSYVSTIPAASFGCSPVLRTHRGGGMRRSRRIRPTSIRKLGN